ncbi:MAG: o-succinylbenzoate synthase [Armatimonadetes bacterium]|nr:o-succinylbenzoate synthase [Armatimonadota bacterium]
MRLERIDLRVVRLPLRGRFETSVGACHEKVCILVEAHAEGVSGWGECVAETEPSYSAETVETAWHVLRDFLAPLVFAHEFADASETRTCFSRVRGNRMAKAALEMALWDWHACARNIPLHRLLGGTRASVACGVSVGIAPSVDALIHEVEGYLGQGYRRIKVKIRPGWDIAPLEAVRARFGDVPLMADANSAYRLDDLKLLQQLDAFDLMMIEQPLAHDDIPDHAILQKQLRTAICLDESIRHVDDARHALDAGACRIINIKPGRVGGLEESRRIAALCAARGVPVWCGGMLETGVGRGHNLALATLDAFIMPGDTSDSRRYFEEDITEPRATMDSDGVIPLPDNGYPPCRERLARFTERVLTLKP